jgi:hypothetical protein
MKDLSTLEYLYVFRCCSASSETHSFRAVSAHPTIISTVHSLHPTGAYVPLLGGMVGWVTGAGRDMGSRGA